MTQRSWPWSTVAALGDGVVELSEAISREFLATYFGVQDPAVEGVSKGVMGELAVSGIASPLSVQPGSAICYGLFTSDDVETLAVATPAVGTTGGRVILRTNWAGTSDAYADEAETRLAIKMSADGVATPPASLTQNFGVTWEIGGPTFTITTGGVINVSGGWTFRRSTAVVGGAEVEANSIGNANLRDSAAVSVIGRAANSSGDPADIAAGANDRLLARVSNALSFVQLSLGMIPDGMLTFTKMANMGPTSVAGRSGNSAGVMAPIAAGANDRVLARVADALSFVQVSLAMLANDSVDDTKVGNRVPQFYRRQGGNASDWAVAGSTAQTPTTVRMQAGTRTLPAEAEATITFPVAFSQKPLVYVSQASTGTAPRVGAVTATTFELFGGGLATVNWLAIGPE